MSLKRLQKHILSLAAEEFKWSFDFVALEVTSYNYNLRILNSRCIGSGFCFLKVNDCFYKAKGTACKCELTPCPKCADLFPSIHLMCNAGYCSSCNLKRIGTNAALSR